jgi:hypothetical protein
MSITCPLNTFAVQGPFQVGQIRDDPGDRMINFNSQHLQFHGSEQHGGLASIEITSNQDDFVFIPTTTTENIRDLVQHMGDGNNDILLEDSIFHNVGPCVFQEVAGEYMLVSQDDVLLLRGNFADQPVVQGPHTLQLQTDTFFVTFNANNNTIQVQFPEALFIVRANAVGALINDIVQTLNYDALQNQFHAMQLDGGKKKRSKRFKKSKRSKRSKKSKRSNVRLTRKRSY